MKKFGRKDRPFGLRPPTKEEMEWVESFAKQYVSRVSKGVFKYKNHEEANADWYKWMAQGRAAYREMHNLPDDESKDPPKDGLKWRINSMELAEHADACRQELGKPFFEVHNFIDQYAQDFGGFAHRRLLHHSLGVKLVLEKFGEDAARAAELHIKQDTKGIIPEDWANYGEPLLLHLDDYDRQDQILRELYGDEVFDAVQAKL